jgi:polysaccharide biosynthesis transport protein
MTSKPPFIERHLTVLPQAPADAELDLHKLWLSVWLRKWLILGAMLVIALFAVWATSWMTPLYRAGATLLVESERAKLLAIEQPDQGETLNNDFLLTEIELLKSRRLAERVVRQLDLVNHPEFVVQPSAGQGEATWLQRLGQFFGVTQPGEAVQSQGAESKAFDKATETLMAATSVNPRGKSQVVAVEVLLADPYVAMSAANALVDGYIASKFEAGVANSATATSWMDSRLEELRQKLQASEDRLQAYRESEGLVDLQGISTIAATELTLTSDRLINARRQRAETESQYRQVEAMKNSRIDDLASVPAVLADPVIQQFKATKAQAAARVDEVSQRYGPGHPELIAAKADLDAATTSLKTQVSQVVTGIQRNYQLAVANEQSQQALFDSNKYQIQDLSSKEFKVRELALEVEANRALYDTFLVRLKETAATADQNSVNVHVVDRAMVPEEPVKPNKPLMVAVAALIALFGVAGTGMVKDVMDDTFTTTEAIENTLNIPVLGIVPLIQKAQREQLAGMYAKDENHFFTETIRTIRTRLEMANADHHSQVIVTTSALPGEGKSVLSANLAHALAQMGKVILIDADLRKPTLARNFGLPKESQGLTDILEDRASLESCVTACSGVDVICAGTAVRDPLRLLASSQFSMMIETLKTQYDRIIIDSPPTQGVSDVMVLAAQADTLIFIVRSGVTSRTEVERGVAQLQQNATPVDWVILNQVDIRKAERHGYRYSSYYDYYQYGNGAAT